MRLVARPIEVWPGEPTANRETGRFTALWGDTVDLLEREVGLLQKWPVRQDVEVILQLSLSERDCRLDGGIRANAKPADPRVIISFESKHGPLTYWCDQYDKGGWRSGGSLPGWQANVRAIALGLEALRKVERYGIAHRGQQYKGWTAIGPGSIELGPARMSKSDAIDVFMEAGVRDVEAGIVKPLLRRLYPEQVEVYFKAAAKKHHPDVGGDEEFFKRLVEARDVLIGGGP